MPLILTEKTGINLAVDGGNLDVSVDPTEVQVSGNSVSLPAGSLGSLAMRFVDDTDTGLYRQGINSVSIVSGGAEGMRVSPLAVTPLLQVQASAGSAAAPHYSFSGDGDTGVFRTTADQVGLSAGGVERVRVSSASPYLQVNDGSMREVWHQGNMPLASGSWTPVLTANVSNPIVSYISQVGTYTKMGNIVFCEFRITTLSRSGGSGTLQISLPFPSASGLASATYASWVETAGVAYLSGAVDLALKISGSSSSLAVINYSSTSGGIRAASVEIFTTGSGVLAGGLIYEAA